MEQTTEDRHTATQTGRVGDYARMVRIEHALFSLPLFVAGALVAGREYFPVWLDWVYIVLAGTSARNLALALNRYIDRELDARNPRTQSRELPSGALSTGQVIWFISVNLLVYAGTAWLIAPICLYLSWIPVAIFVAYPLLKRFTMWCHLGVGAGLAMAPLGGYLAAAKSWPISSEAWLLAGFTWLWVGGFDIIYAQLDVDFDRAHGVYSLPSRMGPKALRVALGMHALAMALLGMMWLWSYDGSPWLLIPLFAMGLLFFLQHRHSDRVNWAAFRINTLVGFVMLAFVIVGIIS
jgi:4-hydroxybenzoate polyprenyltransferase